MVKRERIPDDEFKENVRNGFTKLVGKVIKITIRAERKTDLKTLIGTLISVGKETFTLLEDSGDETQLEYELINVHFYSSPYDKEPAGTWPLRYRK